MSFAIPIALWSLIAIPILVGIYLFRRRFRQKTVSALFLWESPRLKTGGGRKVSKLESTLLLLIEILIAAMLAMAAAAPGCHMQKKAFSAVIVLDDSASMSAHDKDGVSARKSSVDKLTGLLGSNSPFSCSIIVSGPAPKLLISDATNLAEVRQVLEKWTPSQPLHDLNPAFHLARQISNEKTRMILFTDAAPSLKENGEPEIPEGLVWYSEGSPLENTGIVSASRKRDMITGKEKIFLLLEQFSTKSSDITVTGYLKNEKLFSETVKFADAAAGNAQKKFYVELTRFVEGPITIKVTPEDSLDADNSCVLLPENPVALRILVKFADPAAGKIFDDTLVSMGREVTMTDSRPHLILSDSPSFTSEKQKIFPDAWGLTLLINSDLPAIAAGKGVPASPQPKSEPATNYGPYIVEKSHPICENITLYGTRWTAIRKSKVQKDMLPVISCGENMLLAESSDLDSQKMNFFMYYIPDRSNLHKVPAWPVLMHNLVRKCAESFSGFREKNYRVGTVARAKFPNSKSIVLKRLVTDSHDKADRKSLPEKIEFPGGDCVFTSTQPALYDVEYYDGTQKNTDMISFNFLSREESDLRKLGKGKWGDKASLENVVRPSWRDEAWIFILIACALALLHIYLVRKKEVEGL